MKLTSEYTREEVDAMRERLLESVFEQVGDRDIREMLMDGVMGFNQMLDVDIIERYNEIYENSGD
tara:strand:- start:369 stop:563 length:195 start_codon:yes stop_codon:yes gene_type:complete